MSIAFYILNNTPPTFNPTNPTPEQTHSAQNKPNLNNSLIRLNAWLKKTYNNITQKPKNKTNPIQSQNEPNFGMHTRPETTQKSMASHRGTYLPIRQQSQFKSNFPTESLILIDCIKNIANLSKCLYINSLNLESINTNERIFPLIA